MYNKVFANKAKKGQWLFQQQKKYSLFIIIKLKEWLKAPVKETHGYAYYFTSIEVIIGIVD